MTSHETGSTTSTHSTAAAAIITGCDRSKAMRRPSPRTGSAMLMRTACAASPHEGGEARSCEIRRSSHLEDRRVPLLDLLSVLLDALRVFLHKLDLVERAHARLLHRLLVRGVLARHVDQHLLAFARVHPVLKQPRGVRVGTALEDRA